MPNRLGIAWKPKRHRRYFRWREAQQQTLRYQAREIMRLNDKIKEDALLALAASVASGKRICSLIVELKCVRAAAHPAADQLLKRAAPGMLAGPVAASSLA